MMSSNQFNAQIREYILHENLQALITLIEKKQLDLYLPIDLNGLTPLHYAVQNSKKKIVDPLCNIMYDMKGLNVKDTLGRSPLHYAASKGNIPILESLIAAGADVNATTIGGETPLMKAIMFNKVDAVSLLLRFGSDFLMKNQVSKMNCKDLAIRSRNKAIIWLISRYEDILAKLCLIVYVYFYQNSPERQNALHKLTTEMIKKLTYYIIP